MQKVIDKFFRSISLWIYTLVISLVSWLVITHAGINFRSNNWNYFFRVWLYQIFKLTFFRLLWNLRCCYRKICCWSFNVHVGLRKAKANDTLLRIQIHLHFNLVLVFIYVLKLKFSVWSLCFYIPKKTVTLNWIKQNLPKSHYFFSRTIKALKLAATTFFSMVLGLKRTWIRK